MANVSGSRVLVVGAGFAGVVYARLLAEAGWEVDLIDRRPHVAGNAYDEVTAQGVRKHRYGPHLFHTNNEKIVDWLSQFTELVPYEHKVEAQLEDGSFVPLPINKATIGRVLGIELATTDDVEQALRRLRVAPDLRPDNAFDYLVSQLGEQFTELFFQRYTRKMWGLSLSDLPSSVVKRIPIRLDDEDRYFPNDRFQFLPRFGYERTVNNILDHDKINVTLDEKFDRSLLADYFYCFNSMAIDEFFGCDQGMLPYRSIKFHDRVEPSTYSRGNCSVTNFTDQNIYTRETDWSKLPSHRIFGTEKTITIEEPCDYKDNDFERYYPVKTVGESIDLLYDKYKSRADQIENLKFIGRCGTYKYLDMHQVINQSMVGAETWLNNYGRGKG